MVVKIVYVKESTSSVHLNLDSISYYFLITGESIPQGDQFTIKFVPRSLILFPLYTYQVTVTTKASEEVISPAEEGGHSISKRHIATALNSKYENSNYVQRSLADILQHYPRYTGKRFTVTDEDKRHLGRALSARYTVTDEDKRHLGRALSQRKEQDRRYTVTDKDKRYTVTDEDKRYTDVE